MILCTIVGKTKTKLSKIVANTKLRIWHDHFGLVGSNNDINVLDRSSLVINMLKGANNDLTFMVSDVLYH